MQSLRLVLVLALLAPACVHPPSSLGPAGQAAWKQHEVQKDLDLVRDIAQDGNAQTPPVISTATARQVTLWHETAIKAVHDATAGWPIVVTNSLQDLKKNLPMNERAALGRYIDLAIAVVKGVQ